MTKICSKCGIEKDQSEYHKSPTNDGMAYKCKVCTKEYYRGYYRKNKKDLIVANKEYYEKNKNYIKERSKDYRKQYYENNKDKIAEYVKEYSSGYRKKNKDKIAISRKKYHKKNKEKRKEYASKYYKNNKEKLNKYSVEYHNNKILNNASYRMSHTLRARIKTAVREQYGVKAYSTIKLLGCSIEECRQHLESKFKHGMTWDNHGRHGWHIDHIRPCSSFDLTDPEQQKQCFHYTNLQPLWAEENLSKADKFDVPDSSAPDLI